MVITAVRYAPWLWMATGTSGLELTTVSTMWKATQVHLSEETTSTLSFLTRLLERSISTMQAIYGWELPEAWRESGRSIPFAPLAKTMVFRPNSSSPSTAVKTDRYGPSAEGG